MTSLKEKHTFKIIFKIIFYTSLLAIVAAVGLFAYYAKSAPQLYQSKLQNGGGASIYLDNGKFLTTLGSEKRIYLHQDEIPQTLKDAVVSIEDKRFYKEPLGVDPIRTAKSLLSNIKHGHITAGGSSITQQLIKLSFFSTSSSDRTIKRKAQEAWLAMKASRSFSKDQILTYYMNKVYMNYNVYGIGSASKFYYNKKPSELDLSQTALLAGMPNAPTIFDPYKYPEQATYRRNLVLDAMLKNSKITHDQYIQAKKENIKEGLTYNHPLQSKSSRINDPYIKEVITEIKQKGFDPYNDSLKVTINLNQDLQNEIYKLVNEGKVHFTNDKMQVGGTVLDPQNGHVLAIIGGRKLPKVEFGLDRAVQTTRSSGSTIKPLLDYAPAIQYKNWSTGRILSDTPYFYPGSTILVNNWDNGFKGNMTMRYALEQSRNVPAVKTLSDVGLKRAKKFVAPMGINITKNAGLSVGLGADVSSLQLAGAYGALATLGTYHKPQFISKISTVDGDTYRYDVSGERVMSASTAYMITDMLKGVIKSGSGTQAQIPGLIQAGKTGTVKYSDEELRQYPSYNDTPKDSWFVGYTPQDVVSIWTGYDNLKDGKISGEGENSAQALYKAIMEYIYKEKTKDKTIDWKMPDSVVKQKGELYVIGHEPKEKKKKKANKNSSKKEREHVGQEEQDINNSSVQRSSQSEQNQNSHRVYRRVIRGSQRTRDDTQTQDYSQTQRQNYDDNQTSRSSSSRNVTQNAPNTSQSSRESNENSNLEFYKYYN
ncbi:penicillin-binding protein (plasmid) [Lactobacillus sp. PV037]|uniref:transglycosylase domain-containing protein n=1 Tax=Lactobacillus sp. PV037 TaxID=2594496 RepID=UPI00223EE6CA|nr:transglycosylase domain-containing protein [Lactobacillus sp. PV037]QNQ82961.1 penicillin-binding protein [Lactobacillus sp. PV037]